MPASISSKTSAVRVAPVGERRRRARATRARVRRPTRRARAGAPARRDWRSSELDALARRAARSLPSGSSATAKRAAGIASACSSAAGCRFAASGPRARRAAARRALCAARADRAARCTRDRGEPFVAVVVALERRRAKRVARCEHRVDRAAVLLLQAFDRVEPRADRFEFGRIEFDALELARDRDGRSRRVALQRAARSPSARERPTEARDAASARGGRAERVAAPRARCERVARRAQRVRDPLGVGEVRRAARASRRPRRLRRARRVDLARARSARTRLRPSRAAVALERARAAPRQRRRARAMRRGDRSRSASASSPAKRSSRSARYAGESSRCCSCWPTMSTTASPIARNWRRVAGATVDARARFPAAGDLAHRSPSRPARARCHRREQRAQRRIGVDLERDARALPAAHHIGRDALAEHEARARRAASSCPNRSRR